MLEMDGIYTAENGKVLQVVVKTSNGFGLKVIDAQNGNTLYYSSDGYALNLSLIWRVKC